jgi:hypothetical protein
MPNIWEVPKTAAYYFARSYFSLWTAAEANAQNAFFLEGKIERIAKVDQPSAEEMQGHWELMVGDPGVAGLFQKGWQQFYDDLVTRICQEHADQLPKCRRCNAVLRTGKARQCFDCGYDWHTPHDDEPQSPPTANPRGG